MTASPSLQTASARLATFSVAHRISTKGRTSNAKSTKYATWPHERISPAELAHVGFYFTPTSISPDNTTCFLCERSLDGWEEEDDPLTEHLRLSSECGWAVTLDIARRSSNPAKIEDPASQAIEDARRATFVSWPHERKKGWACKTEKLVQTGWYFCPNDESDDLVSCAYCNLSLDGWEPTDDPFDEHYRRSSDCSFFQYANAPKKRTTRSKAGRPSKTSRASTQSTNTVLSEAPTLDFDDTLDNSMLSQSSKTSKASKKGTKQKTKAAKSKKVDEIESNNQYGTTQNYDDEILNASESRKNGRKRKSDAISETGSDDNHKSRNKLSPGPPVKKRATGTRIKNAVQNKNSSAIDSVELATDDELAMNAERPSKATGKKKRSTSKTRKEPKSSIASVASARPRIPDDNEIDAALEADLEREDSNGPETAFNNEHYQVADTPDALSTASAAPIRRKDKRSRNDADFDDDPEEVPKKNTRKKNTVKKKDAKKTTPDALPSDVDMDEDVSQLQDTRAKPTESKPKKTKKKADSSEIKSKSHVTGSKTSKIAKCTTSRNKIEPQESYVDDVFDHSEIERSSSPFNGNSAIHEPVNRDSQDTRLRGAKKEQKNSKSRLEAPARDNLRDKTAASPMNPTPRQQQKYTPSPSPQSSDAENRPPSSKLSVNATTFPPSHSQTTSVPLAASTPTRRATRSDNVNTDHPWDPVDLDDAFEFDPSDNKENINLEDILHAATGELTTLEKNMTVEEWISWNAKKGEEKLRNECERVVNIFEREGGRAMRSLEGIQCID